MHCETSTPRDASSSRREFTLVLTKPRTIGLEQAPLLGDNRQAYLVCRGHTCRPSAPCARFAGQGIDTQSRDDYDPFVTGT